MLKTFMALLFAGTALGAADLVELTMDDGRTLIGEYDEAAGVLRSTSHGIKVMTSIDPEAVVRVQAYIQTHEEYLRERTGGASDPSLADARRLLAVTDQRIERITADIEALNQAIQQLTTATSDMRHDVARERVRADKAQRNADSINDYNSIDITGATSPAVHRNPMDNRTVRIARIERDRAKKTLRAQEEDERALQVRMAHLRNKRLDLQRELLEVKEQRRRALATVSAAGTASSSSQPAPAPSLGRRGTVDVGMVHRLPDMVHEDIHVRNAQVKWLRYEPEAATWRLGFMAQVHSTSDQLRWYQVRLVLLDGEGYLLEEFQESGSLNPGLGGIVRATYSLPRDIAERMVDIDLSLH